MVVPLRGQAEISDLPKTKSIIKCSKKNHRSAEARHRKSKLRRLRVKERHRNLMTALKVLNLSPADFKIKKSQLRKERKSCALVLKSPTNSENAKSTFESKETSATRDLKVLCMNSKSKQFLSPRSTTFIGTFNVRTLTNEMRLNELLYYCILRNIQVLAIQEHKLLIKDSDEKFIRRRLPLGWWFIYSSATLTCNNIPVGGVGFLLFPIAYKNICSINKISDNSIWFKF